MIIYDLWCHCYNWFGHQEPHPYKMVNLINKCVYPLGASLTGRSPISLLPGPPYSLRLGGIEIRPVNNPTVASKWANKCKSLTSLTLSPKLGVISLVIKAKTDQKLGLLCQAVKL